MKGYFLEKISDINLRIAAHEEDANRRLASEAANIFRLPDGVLPPEHEKRLLELKKLIRSTLQSLSAPGLTPTRLGSIRKSTAAEYIIMLIDFEDYVKSEIEKQDR